MTPEVPAIAINAAKTVSQSNLFLLDTMMELATIFESGKFNNGNYNEFKSYRKKIKSHHDHYKEQINICMHKLFQLAEYQELHQLINY